MGGAPRPWLALGAAAIFASGCSTVLYVRNPEARTYSEPTFETTQHFFFLGLGGGERHVFVDQICLGKDFDQLATRYTGGDVLATVFTLGLYAPRTVQVWCAL